MKNRYLYLSLCCLMFAVDTKAQVFTEYDLNPNGNSAPRVQIVHNNKMFIETNDTGSIRNLLVSDGTIGGTNMLNSTNVFGLKKNFAKLYSKVIYNSGEPWVTDGTAAGTKMIKDIYPGTLGSNPQNYIFYSGKLFFSAADTASNTELWATDGTANGTYLVKELCTAKGYYPGFDGTDMIVYKSKLFFSGNDWAPGGNTYFTNAELWVSDGSTTGTQMFKDINLSSGSAPSRFTLMNNKLYFVADDGITGRELWVTDGTPAGTQIVKDINAGHAFNLKNNTTPLEFVVFNDKLYFMAEKDTMGFELWSSDGTASGTQMVKDIYEGEWSSNPTKFVELNGKLYFTAQDAQHGRELWVTDGTEQGTQLVKDVFAGQQPSNPVSLIAYHGKLYFAATEEFATNMYVTDGTQQGTMLLSPPVDLNSYGNPLRSGYFNGFTEYNDKLYFGAYYKISTGAELWSFSDEPAPVSIPNSGINDRTLVYPNPARKDEVINIEYTVSEPGSVTLKLTDLMGRVVATITNNDETPGAHTMKFKACDHSLAAGMYSLQLTTNKGTVVRKINIL